MKGKRIIALVLCLLMTLALLPTATWAAGEGTDPSLPGASETGDPAEGAANTGTEGEGEGEGTTPPAANSGEGEGETTTPPAANSGEGEGEGTTPPAANSGTGEGEGTTPPAANSGTGEGEGGETKGGETKGEAKGGETKGENETETLRGGTRNGDIYTVVGDSSVFGSHWDLNDDSNDMELSSGTTYSKSYSIGNINCTVEFKVVKNHAYSGEGHGSWPSNNYQCKVIGPGDFVITFNASTGDISISGSSAYYPTDFGPAYLATNDNTWASGGTWEHQAMTHVGHNVYEKQVTFPTSGTKEFKITNGTWDDNTKIFGFGNGNYESFGTAQNTSSPGNNISFYANAGTYKIRFEYSTTQSKITISRLCSVNLTQSAGGTITATVLSGYSGAYTQINAVPDSGYELDKLNYNGGYYTSAQLPINHVFGNEDITITAEFRQTQTPHNIAVEYSTYSALGSNAVTFQKNGETVTQAVAGDQITVVVGDTSASGLVPTGTYDVYYGNDANPTDTGLTLATGTFTMPDQNVRVSVPYRHAEGMFLALSSSTESAPASSSFTGAHRLSPWTEDDTYTHFIVYTVNGTNNNGSYFWVAEFDSTGAMTQSKCYTEKQLALSDSNRQFRVCYSSANNTITLFASYTITPSAIGSGTITVASSAYAGDTVPVTVSPDAGYVLSGVTILRTSNGSPASFYSNGSFQMPACDVSVMATFVEAPRYSLAVKTNPRHGTVTFLNESTNEVVTEAMAGETIRIQIDNVDEGYQAVYYKVDSNYNGTNVYPDQAVANTFVMPASQAIVTVTYRPAQSGYYWVFNTSYPTAPVDRLTPSQRFTQENGLYFSPAEMTSSGYIAVTSYDATTHTMTSLTLPNGGWYYHVTSSDLGAGVVRFNPDATSNNTTFVRQYAINKSITGQGTVTVPEYACVGDTVSVSATAETGSHLQSLTITDGSGDPVTVTNDTFVMPNSAVTVTAKFASDNGYFVIKEGMTAADLNDDYLMPWYAATPSTYNRYKFSTSGILGVGDNIHVVKMESGSITEYYPRADYWMTLQANNINDYSYATTVSFRPEGFAEEWIPVADQQGDVYSEGRYFYVDLYGTLTVTTNMYDVHIVSPHGTVTGIGEGHVVQGSSVTLTVTPDEDYEVASVTLVDASNTNVPYSVDGSNYTFRMPASDVTFTVNCTRIPPSFNGHALVLTGQIGVQFLMELPGGYTQWPGSYMTYTIEHGTTTARWDTSSDLDSFGNDLYGYRAYVSSIQMADKITPTFHYKVNDQWTTIEGDPYSAEDYISWGMYNNNTTGDALDIIKALADYGYYAQQYLSVQNHWTIGTNYAAMTKKWSNSFDYDAVYTALANDTVSAGSIQDLAYQVIFGSTTSLQIRFKANGQTVTVPAGGTYKTSGEHTIVTFGNIYASNLKTAYTVEVGTESVTISPMSFVRLALGYNDSNIVSDAFKDLLCAFYHYAAACGAFNQN